MKAAKKSILLFRDAEGFGNAIFSALQSYPISNLQRLDHSFELSLEKYGIKDSKASGNISHFVNGNGVYEVSLVLMENYEPPILPCALNEVLASLVGESSPEIPTFVVPFVVATPKLKLETKNAISSHKTCVYGLQFGSATHSVKALSSKLQKPPPSLQIYHEQLACFLQFMRVLRVPAFVVVGQSGQDRSTGTSEKDLEVINEIGELLADYSSLSFSKEKIAIWNPIKCSRVTEEPWRALYG